MKTIFREIGLLHDYDSFVEEYAKILKNNGFNWTKKRICSLRYDFTIIRHNDIFAFIEYDGEQHFIFVELFFKTLEVFLFRHNTDEVKTEFAEYTSIPLLRIRYDQIDDVGIMIKDMLDNPNKYRYQHNTFLTDEEYWSVFHEENELLVATT